MTMATILSFHPRGPAGPASLPPDHEAELIVFPGVRYERREPDGGDGRPPGPKRKQAAET
jgi:hypothetical protein